MTQSSLDNPPPFTQEVEFSHTINHQIAQFWQQREEEAFIGEEGVTLQWVKFTHPKHNKSITVINGRIESFWKYQELFYDFYQLGYDIYSYDHRGQGVSGRVAKDPQVGHVTDFNHYILDLQSFVDTQLPHHQYQHNFLLSHSMGGAITTRYVQQHKHPFTSMVLGSPMFGIHIPLLFRPFAYSVSKLIDALCPYNLLALGESNYKSKPYKNNLLTQSEVRYAWFRDLYQNRPELQLGGPSSRWVWQGIQAAKMCIEQADKVDIPVLLLQGESDIIVDNNAQDRFQIKMQQANLNCIKHQIPGAKHELFMEKDALRNQTLQQVEQFYNLFVESNKRGR
ncbi:MAG: alpha/beta fold hydrolase [Aliivibrio sp.]|uniref:alpha/beta fold hydrolase n=1 Tax=Aliivibrio sp. TaxID=1872443 RepID=UPI001A3E04F7|nr:alpha/beta fold hydrolase [Aliivibrio sp.]